MLDTIKPSFKEGSLALIVTKVTNQFLEETGYAGYVGNAMLNLSFVYQKKCRPNELLMICEERTGFRRPSPDLI